jgi:demethylmenaquinone methyltransferase/2-methoxy-6-polyprenyl-1,4-benzoquinol methylase
VHPATAEPGGRNRFAIDLFAPIADDYELWSRALSFWQDPYWRRTMVKGLGLPPGARVLDVAAGTGEVTRLLEAEGYQVVSLDQSREMLARAAERGARTVAARAEALPFADRAFEGLSVTYLLRYVEDVEATLAELARVIRPGGRLGMVEFGMPHGLKSIYWHTYMRAGLPLAGSLIDLLGSRGWGRVGRFLPGSIADFHRRFPPDKLERTFLRAGFARVRLANLSWDGGLVIWADLPG